MLTIFLLAVTFGPVHNLSAQQFNPHHVYVSDASLFIGGDVSQSAIQRFLERENSVLARFAEIVEGQTKTAAEIIYNGSVTWNISTKFLLANLEKEQGLISGSHATEKKLQWAMGYGCFSGSCKEKFRGFANQVNAAAETQNIYRQKTFAFSVGQTTKTFDGFPVTPKNQATTNLYIYTPYLGDAPELGIYSNFGGVKLFWKIMQRYFPEKKYPNGLMVKNGGNYWLIEEGKKRKFLPPDIFLQDYKENDALEALEKDLNAYPDGPLIQFANNTLVRSSATSQVFLLENGKKRLVTDNTALAKLTGYRLALESFTEVPTVLHDYLLGYIDGEPIRDTTRFPQERLFKDPTGQMYLLHNNQKRPIHASVASINFPYHIPEPIESEGLQGYLTLGAAKIKDGIFVKTETGNYYLITDGERKKIKPGVLEQVFGAQKLQTARLVSEEALELHAAGIPIDYMDEMTQDAPTVQTTPLPSGQIFAAEFHDILPKNLILLSGQTTDVTVVFKNTGDALWEQENIFLQVEESQEKIRLSEKIIAPLKMASFGVSLVAPQKAGITSKRFTLYREKDGEGEKIASVGKFIPVRGGSSAQLLEHTLPIALKQFWKPTTVQMKFKNTSEKTWYSRKTALIMYDAFGGQSPLYDRYDWVRSDVPAVPLNKEYIEPQDEAVFTFTLDPRKAELGVQTYLIEIKRLDQEEDKQEVYIDGNKTLSFKIRIDEK